MSLHVCAAPTEKALFEKHTNRSGAQRKGFGYWLLPENQLSWGILIFFSHSVLVERQRDSEKWASLLNSFLSHTEVEQITYCASHTLKLLTHPIILALLVHDPLHYFPRTFYQNIASNYCTKSSVNHKVHKKREKVPLKLYCCCMFEQKLTSYSQQNYCGCFFGEASPTSRHSKIYQTKSSHRWSATAKNSDSGFCFCNMVM